MTTPQDTLDTPDHATGDSMTGIRVMPMALIGAYSAICIATLMDALHGQNLIATSSLLLVGGVALALLHLSRFLAPLETIDDWLWQLARCSALAGLCGATVGLCILFLGNGSFHTMTTGLSLAAFSVLYGVLIAMPAGCIVVLADDASS